MNNNEQKADLLPPASIAQSNMLGELHCHWCEQPIQETAVGSGFLTGIFGYLYCSEECMEDEINSK